MLSFVSTIYVEAFYEDNITKDKSKKPHLEYRWCIIDKHGVEKVEFKSFSSPYLVDDSVIYSLDSSYYNIETGEFYGKTLHSIRSRDFLFLKNTYDKNEKKRGVMKINKKDGSWELFPA